MSPRHSALALDRRPAHGPRHHRSRFPQFVPAHLVFKWLNGYVGPLESNNSIKKCMYYLVSKL